MKQVTMHQFKSIGHLFNEMMPTYRHNDSHPLFARFKWDDGIVDLMEQISAKRCAARRASYLIDGELERAARMNQASASAGASIRFGHSKSGYGYSGTRKDFCLVGGVYKGRTLTLFYRRLDLLGGLFFDTTIVREVERAVGPIQTVAIMAVRSGVLAKRGNSNEKLYKRLKKEFS